MTSSPPAPSSPAGIRFTDRVIVLGRNGSGKSVLINYLASLYRCQVVLFDTKDEFTVPGVDPVHSLERVDWQQPIIHLIDDTGDLDDVDRLFRTALARKTGRDPSKRYGLVIVAHELADLCADTPGGTPPAVNAYIRKGRAHGLGLLAGSQRPRNIPRAARTEAQHVFAFAGGFDPEDLPIVAKMLAMSLPDCERALEQAASLSPTGEHSYIWRDDRARTTVVRPPLPERLIDRSLASGLDPSTHSKSAGVQSQEDGRDGGSRIEASRGAGETAST